MASYHHGGELIILLCIKS